MYFDEIKAQAKTTFEKYRKLTSQRFPHLVEVKIAINEIRFITRSKDFKDGVHCGAIDLELAGGLVRLRDDLIMIVEENKTALRVFLCHSSNDKIKVMQLYDQLRNENGIDPWMDTDKLLPGVEWDSEIRSAIKDSHIVMVCLSKKSINKEGYVQKEIRQALDVADEKPDGTIFIIPLRLENCEVPDRLKRWQWIDLFEKDSYEKLLISLRKRATELMMKDTGSY